MRLQKAAKAMKLLKFLKVSFGDEAFLNIVQNNHLMYSHHHVVLGRKVTIRWIIIFKPLTKTTPSKCQQYVRLWLRTVVRQCISASIFEGGINGSKPFSPHGLIKQITSQTTEFYASHAGLHFSRFVIPNPFGALDNPKLIDYLCREWYAGRTPQIRTPLYVRDNIHVELMAKGFVVLA